MTRKWFQIHLSTAIILLFILGILIWANFGGRSDFGIVSIELHWTHQPNVSSEEVRHSGKIPLFGWPYRARDSLPLRYTTGAMVLDQNIPAGDIIEEVSVVWHWDAIAADILIAFLLILVAAFGIEFLTRRREIKKP